MPNQWEMHIRLYPSWFISPLCESNNSYPRGMNWLKFCDMAVWNDTAWSAIMNAVSNKPYIAFPYDSVKV